MNFLFLFLNFYLCACMWAFVCGSSEWMYNECHTSVRRQPEMSVLSATLGKGLFSVSFPCRAFQTSWPPRFWTFSYFYLSPSPLQCWDYKCAPLLQASKIQLQEMFSTYIVSSKRYYQQAINYSSNVLPFSWFQSSLPNNLVLLYSFSGAGALVCTPPTEPQNHFLFLICSPSNGNVPFSSEQIWSPVLSLTKIKQTWHTGLCHWSVTLVCPWPQECQV